MLVRSIMSTNVITISVSAGLHQAAAVMKEHGIRHLPVVKDGRLIGLVTETDVRSALFPAMLEDISVKDLMVNDPYTVTPDTVLEDAARVFYRNKIGCLPVVDSEGDLQGIVTIADMLAALIEVMGFLFASSRLDVILPERPESLEEAIRIIQRHGGRIIGISLNMMKKDEQVHLFRMHKTNLEPIVQAMEKAGFSVISSMN